MCRKGKAIECKIEMEKVTSPNSQCIKNKEGNVMNKKYNIVLSLLFIVYLLGYFSISKTLIPIMCVIQVFSIENIFRVRNRIIQIGEMIIIVASIILFIDSILSL